MSYDFMLQQAVSLHDQGFFDDAEKLYRQLLEAMPEQPDILNLLGLIAQAKGVDNEAIYLFYKAIKNAPDRAPFYFNLAISLKACKKFYEAIDNFEKALKIQTDIKEAYVQIGQIYYELGDSDKAQENYYKALEFDPNYTEALARLAITLDDNEALDILLKNDKDPLSLYFAAVIYMRLNKLEYAEKFALNAAKLAPQVDEIKVLLGQICMEKNDFILAEEYFMKAYLLNKYNEAAIIGLANLHVKNDKLSDAENLYKKLLDINPDNLDANINYAALMHKQKRFAEALEQYRKAVIINPNIPEISYNLALVLKDVEEYEEALGLLFNALEKNPTKMEFSATIAELIFILYRNDSQKAIKIAQNWCKSYPNNAFANHVLSALKGEKSEVNKVYTENLFELFADNYELVMSNLGYSVPLAMARILGNVEATIVDLGCGSGLVGQAIKNAKNHIIGVDISKNMLKIAETKNVYDELICADILDYLKYPNNAEWFVAADVFNYIGNLEEILKLLKYKKILFSIEILKSSEEYKLSNTGRFVHNPEYVKKLLRVNGFKNIIEHNLILRHENNEPVEGILFEAK